MTMLVEAGISNLPPVRVLPSNEISPRKPTKLDARLAEQALSSPIDLSTWPEEDYTQAAYSQLMNHPILSSDEEQGYSREYLKYRPDQRAMDARDALVLCNQRLCAYMAEKYMLSYGRKGRQHLGSAVSIWDFVQEANIGLLRAIEKYDPDMEFRFSTYA